MAVGAARCFPEGAMTELTRRRIVAAAFRLAMQQHRATS